MITEMMVVLWSAGGVAALAQNGVTAAAVPGELTRVAGIASGSGVAYALIALEGRYTAVDASSSTRVGTALVGRPRLIAQCSKSAEGKLKFELQADEPGYARGTGLEFEAPWMPTKGELFAPPLKKVQVTMEFLGYVYARPMKRQWEYPFGSSGLIRYAAPGRASSNLEEVRYYLRYLRSLPLLRLTVAGVGTEEFETSKWQAEVEAEPLCGAGGKEQPH